MASVEDVLDRVDGLRRDAAERIQERFATVTELASATTDQLTDIRGIGAVMADRIHAAAVAATSRETPAPRPGAGATAPPAEPREERHRPRGHEDGGLASTVGKVVEVATGTARVVVDRAAPTARKLVDRASEPAKKVVERVTRRGR